MAEGLVGRGWSLGDGLGEGKSGRDVWGAAVLRDG